MSVPPLPKLIGKSVKERYGRYRGTVVAVETDENNQPKAIVYENGGILVRSDPSCFEINETEVEIAPPIVYQGERLYQEMSVFMVREEALLNLRNKGVVTAEVYREVDDELEDAYEILLHKGEETVRKLEKRLKNVEVRRDWIYRLLMNLEVVRRMKLAKEKDHATAYEKLEKELFTALNEADEIKRLTIDITSMMSNIQQIREQDQLEQAPLEIVQPNGSPEPPKTNGAEISKPEETVVEVKKETSVELA